MRFILSSPLICVGINIDMDIDIHHYVCVCVCVCVYDAEDEMVRITNSLDANLRKLQEVVKDSGA